MKQLSYWLLAIFTVFVIFYIAFGTLPITICSIQGISMEPSLHDGKHVLVERLSLFRKPPADGDVVIAKFDDQHVLVKRVIGTAGQRIEIHNGALYRNGEMVHELYVKSDMTKEFPAFTVPKGEVFLMGDNRDISKDSRDPSVGPFTVGQIEGRVFATF